MPASSLSSHKLRTATASAESLPLHLPAPSPLPGNLRPEASVPCIEPFDDPAWRFTVDWDGCRALLFAGPDGEVWLQGESLTDLTSRFPELGGAGRSLRRKPAVLDGVIAVLDPEGRPDLVAIASRAQPATVALRRRPAVFLATDLLYLGDSPTLGWPLERRLDALATLIGDGVGIQAPEYVEGRGEALAFAASQRGLTALLARRSAARYHCGVSSPDRLRILLENRTTCVVAGFRHGASGSGMLLLGEYKGGRLVPAGTVAAPADRPTAGWLRRRLLGLRVAHPQLPGPSPAAVTWLRPALTATVDHEGRTSDGSLRSPSLIAVRDDVDPVWCVRRDAVFPPQPLRRRFMPTVLEALPLDAAVMPHGTE